MWNLGPACSTATSSVLRNTYFPMRPLQTRHTSPEVLILTPVGPEALVQTNLPQVYLDDDVGDGIEHKLHILGVCGTSEVGVDLLGVFSFI